MGLKALIKKNPLVYAAAKKLRTLSIPFLRLYMTACHSLRGVEKNKVYFSSFSGKLYNENPKYVCEALLKLCPEAKIVFRLNRQGMQQAEIPPQVIRVPQNSPAALYHMATARVIVKNARFKPYMKKFPDQTYIQLWHGDRGLKKIALDLEPGRTDKYIDWKYMDLAVTGSRFGSETYMRLSFGYKGEIMECGYPKNDLLLANPPSVVKRVRSALNIPKDTRVLLYAPTFRDRNTGSAMVANFSIRRLQQVLERSSGQKWMVLVRSHTLNHGVSADMGLDVSGYPDVNELLLVCDMLVTDYSSVGGDFMLLDRPILLYHADQAAYTSVDRALAFDPAQSPYRIAHSEEELLALAADPGDCVENCRELRAFYGVRESGHASEAVARRICEILAPK